MAASELHALASKRQVPSPLQKSRVHGMPSSQL